MMNAIIHVFIREIDRSGILCRMRPTRKRGLSIMVGRSGEPCCTVGRLYIRRKYKGKVCDLLSVTKRDFLQADFKP